MIMQDEKGITDFALLKSSIAHQLKGLVFIGFDMLQRDLRSAPIVERRAQLQKLLGGNEGSIEMHSRERQLGQAPCAGGDRLPRRPGGGARLS